MNIGIGILVVIDSSKFGCEGRLKIKYKTRTHGDFRAKMGDNPTDKKYDNVIFK